MSGEVTPERIASWQRLGIVPKRQATHLGITVQDGVIRRGDRVALRPTVSGSTSEGVRNVGLVCTELYETIDGQGGTELSTATAHESWVELEPFMPSGEIMLTIPPDAPFSYLGRALSFVWRAQIQEPRRLRTDPRATHLFWVFP